jgi:hypothetical protein
MDLVIGRDGHHRAANTSFLLLNWARRKSWCQEMPTAQIHINLIILLLTTLTSFLWKLARSAMAPLCGEQYPCTRCSSHCFPVVFILSKHVFRCRIDAVGSVVGTDGNGTIVRPTGLSYPFIGQPVEGLSGIKSLGNGTYLQLQDNGSALLFSLSLFPSSSSFAPPVTTIWDALCISVLLSAFFSFCLLEPSCNGRYLRIPP